MRILVTGGGGYLGCWLVPTLLSRGHAVRLFDRFCFGEEAVSGFASSPACELVRGDIRRLQECPNLLDDVDAIAHLASLSNDPSCDLNPDMAFDVNVESTRELANLAIAHGVRRFVLASSCAVYGKGMFDLLDEQSPPNPVSTFGRTKLEAERAVLTLKNSFFEPVIARCATLFGWSPRMRFDLAVNQMVATAAWQRRIAVMGGGNQWRPFVYVRDAARALADLIEAPAKDVSGETFNIGSEGDNYSILELARKIAGYFEGVALEVPKDDDDLRSFRVQFDKIRRVLGFRCEGSIESSVREMQDKLADPAFDPFSERFFNVRRIRQLLASPVDEGGEPVASRFIPLARPALGEEEEEAVIEVLRSGWLTTGARVQTFERTFAEAVGAPYAVAVSSCTAALHLCLVQAGVGVGDEVITPPITWASTINTIVNLGARPVFVDVCPNTLNLDPQALEPAITERTKAIIPVHLAGHPCDLDAIYSVARRRGIAVIEDAAHALGAAYRGTPIGNYSDFTCFSFYPIKNITTIDGGAITLKNPDTAEALRTLASHGMIAIAWNRYGRSAVAAPPQVVRPGFKYAMNDVSAAIGLEQLKKFPSFLGSRRRLARMYRAALAGVDEIRLLDVTDNVEHAWHLLIIRLRLDRLLKTRDEIAYALRRENVGTGVHFYGLHLHPYYQEKLGTRPEDLPEATAASMDILSLPLHPLMTDRNVHDVVEALKKILVHARKKT